jgi:2-oxoglutarate ferredoxin oxidoreductase subunit gamma
LEKSSGEISILVAGSGGQGILLLGKLIAYGGMIEGKNVTCFPSYGAEVRGGTANSTVIISERMIGSPIIQSPDILIVMNKASFERFQPKLKSRGLMIYDSSLITSPEIRQDVLAVGIPASEIAATAGRPGPSQKESSPSSSQIRSANMVMLGALLAETGVVRTESASSALERLTPPKRRKSLEGNKEAIRRGIKYIEDKKSQDSRYKAGI